MKKFNRPVWITKKGRKLMEGMPGDSASDNGTFVAHINIASCTKDELIELRDAIDDYLANFQFEKLQANIKES